MRVITKAPVGDTPVMNIGQAGDESVGRWRLFITGDGWTGGSIVPSGYPQGGGTPNGLASLTPSDAIPLAYTVGNDPTLIDPNSTPITAPGLYTVIVDGLSLVLAYVKGSGDDARLDLIPLRG